MGRLPDLAAFYSESGVAPRRLLLERYASLPFPLPSVANDLWTYQLMLLLFTLLAGLALMVGFRTRVSAMVCWLLLLSLHQRNGLILNSGDTLLASLLFWGLFLPWGERWSVDEKRSGSPMDGEPPQLVFSAATVGWCLQMSSVYLFAGLHKFHPYWITEGSALFYALSLGHHATSWADLLLAFPSLLPVLSRLVVGFELFLALGILLPWRRVRVAVLLLAVFMHLVFGLFLEIGIFRYTPLIGLMALWRFSEGEASTRLNSKLAHWSSVPLLLVCLFTWMVNLESLGKGGMLPPKLKAWAPVLTNFQSWGVFAGPGLERDGWFAIEVLARDGKSYDAWRGDQSFSQSRPTLVSDTYPNDRWRKWMLTLPTLPLNDPYRERFPQWCLEQWNLRHPSNPAVRIRVWNVVVLTSPGGLSSPPDWQLISEVGL